ncbi:hypothetical protein A1OE_21 [Candidatus Endolissoclinum faulkneri L2]|uniref:Uncharacterized protein n=1 Tax=Candidatus Endolissoclinum faulkneri L2 TaxID=1193729 RepID=K7ZC26_9PROT|nr:hypothetical protein A1OE_21 [Candidatus Endolissoclinum faulkneri L2]
MNFIQLAFNKTLSFVKKLQFFFKKFFNYALLYERKQKTTSRILS